MNAQGELFAIEGDERIGKHWKKCFKPGEIIKVKPKFKQWWNFLNWHIQWYCCRCKKFI